LSGYVRQGDPEFTDADLEAELDLRDRITATAKAKPYLTPTEAQALVSSRSEDERKIEALVAMGVERGEAGDMIARELETAVDKVLQARMAKEANPDAAETTRRRNVGR
jgi:Holliday junction resolvasome RuvABC DNA-binding subunit